MRTTRTLLDMLASLRRLRRQESWTRAQIEEHQSAALARLRAHAYAHSPFYREFHAGLTDRGLDELPVLTKAMLHDRFDEIVTDPAVDRASVAAHARSLAGDDRFLGQYVVTTSSGTSGKASHILFNRAEWANELASYSRFERHIGSFWGTIRRPRMAIIASCTPWHVSARIAATVRSSWLPILRVDVGEPLASIVEQLNAWQPQVLASYASMAGILADEQSSGRLRIAPKRIVTSAEVLSPELRRRIEAVWGDRVYNQYGATEGGTFAVECTSPCRGSTDTGEHNRGLHLFEDLYIFEVVDEQNRPTPPGLYGDKVLLTVLFNHTLPLIRYELSDRVRMSASPCSCGRAFSLIDGIQGRREEALRFPSQEGGSVAIHPMVFYRILDALPVSGWQVVQENGTLSLHLSDGAHQIPEEPLVNSVREALARQGAVVPAVTVFRNNGVERGHSGKTAHIVSRHEKPELETII